VFFWPGGIDHSAFNAVDGIYNERDDQFSLVNNQQELRPWWRVDLVGTYCVWAINILNRSNGKD